MDPDRCDGHQSRFFANAIKGATSGLLIAFGGSLPFSVLAQLNGKLHPEISWAAAATVAYLCALAAWLNGWGRPHARSQYNSVHRHRYLRLWRSESMPLSRETLSGLVGWCVVIVGFYAWLILAAPDRQVGDL